MWYGDIEIIQNLMGLILIIRVIYSRFIVVGKQKKLKEYQLKQEQ